MPRKPAVTEDTRTPQARLDEAGMHGIVGYQLAQAAIVTDQVFDEALNHEGGLRRVELTILALIQGNADATARQLARALAVTPPNIALWLDKLETRGLVSRSRSASDARVQHLRITRPAATLLQRSVRQLQQGEEKALASLSAAERAMLVELLHKVARSRGR